MKRELGFRGKKKAKNWKMADEKEKKSSMDWDGASKILVEKTNGGYVSDFYVVNLREESVERKVGGCVLRRYKPGGPLIGVESKFFVFGMKSKVCITRDVPEMEFDISHSGASFYDASPKKKSSKRKSSIRRWSPLPTRMCIPDRYDPKCVSLGSKIFVFGGVAFVSSCFGEFLDTANTSAGWTPITIPRTVPVDRYADFISDPVNDRILCIFECSCSLYAYYPNQPIDPWVCIHSSDVPVYPLYLNPAAPIDDIIFYFSNDKRIFIAYDIPTNQTLDVSWSSVKPFGPSQFLRYTFEAFLSLGDNLLCLADCEAEIDPATRQIAKLTLVFYRFHACRSPSNEVVFTPLSVNRIPVQGFKYTSNFLPLQVASE